MSTENHEDSRMERGIRVAARLMALSWASGWIVFGLISGIGEGLKPLSVALQAALPGIVFFVTTIIAWRWEGLGGLMLFAEGMATAIYFLWSTGFFAIGLYFVFLSSILPAFVISSLFILSWRRTREQQAAGLSA